MEGEELTYFKILIKILKLNHALIFLFHCSGYGDFREHLLLFLVAECDGDSLVKKQYCY